MWEQLIVRKKHEIYNGDRFTRLVADGTYTFNRYKNRMYRCTCDCGSVGSYRKVMLLNGQSKSCGCLRRELAYERLPGARAVQAQKGSSRGSDGKYITQDNSVSTKRLKRRYPIMAEQEDILRKIQRCLALANDKRGDANTAAIALKQAQKRMELYNISHTSVLASAVGEASLRSKVSVVNPSQWEVNTMYFITQAFGCRFLWSKGGPEPTKKGYWSIFGPKMQVEVCTYAWVVTMRELLKARTAFVKKMREDPVLGDLPRAVKSKAADDFCMGWGYGIREKISAFADPDGLIKAANEAYQKEKYPNSGKQKTNNRGFGNNAIMHQGAAVSQSFNLHRPMDQYGDSQPLRIGG